MLFTIKSILIATGLNQSLCCENPEPITKLCATFQIGKPYKAQIDMPWHKTKVSYVNDRSDIILFCIARFLVFT
jgi:hypothetical protein